MNKRVVSLVMAVAIALSFINQYFTSKKQDESQAYQQKQAAVEEHRAFLDTLKSSKTNSFTRSERENKN